MEYLQQQDNEIYSLIRQEEQRQAEKIRLIASENYVSSAVMEATGSIFTNKYSEGYAGKRYYEGQQFVDQIETIAIQRAKDLFGAEHINVQPYSGSPANLAVYLAFLNPGDTILGMALPHGGHLTHGSKVSISGKYFHAESYALDEKGSLDYEAIRQKALECKPKILIAGHSAYSRILDFPKFREIADEAGALLMVDMAHFAGLVAGGAHPSPIPYADIVTTTTHKSLRGPRGAMIMCKQEHAQAIDKAVFPGCQGGPHNNTTAAYMLRMLQKIVWGGTDNPDQSYLTDLNLREIVILAPFLLFVFWIGLGAQPFIDLIHPSVAELLNNLHQWQQHQVAGINF